MKGREQVAIALQDGGALQFPIDVCDERVIVVNEGDLAVFLSGYVVANRYRRGLFLGTVEPHQTVARICVADFLQPQLHDARHVGKVHHVGALDVVGPYPHLQRPGFFLTNDSLQFGGVGVPFDAVAIFEDMPGVEMDVAVGLVVASQQVHLHVVHGCAGVEGDTTGDDA